MGYLDEYETNGNVLDWLTIRIVIGIIVFCCSFGYVDYLKRLPAGYEKLFLK